MKFVVILTYLFEARGLHIGSAFVVLLNANIVAVLNDNSFQLIVQKCASICGSSVDVRYKRTPSSRIPFCINMPAVLALEFSIKSTL